MTINFIHEFKVLLYIYIYILLLYYNLATAHNNVPIIFMYKIIISKKLCKKLNKKCKIIKIKVYS